MINPDVTAHFLRHPTSEWVAITGDTRFNPSLGRGRVDGAAQRHRRRVRRGHHLAARPDALTRGQPLAPGLLQVGFGPPRERERSLRGGDLDRPRERGPGLVLIPAHGEDRDAARAVELGLEPALAVASTRRSRLRSTARASSGRPAMKAHIGVQRKERGAHVLGAEGLGDGGAVEQPLASLGVVSPSAAIAQPRLRRCRGCRARTPRSWPARGRVAPLDRRLGLAAQHARSRRPRWRSSSPSMSIPSARRCERRPPPPFGLLVVAEEPPLIAEKTRTKAGGSSITNRLSTESWPASQSAMARSKNGRARPGRRASWSTEGHHIGARHLARPVSSAPRLEELATERQPASMSDRMKWCTDEPPQGGDQEGVVVDLVAQLAHPGADPPELGVGVAGGRDQQQAELVLHRELLRSTARGPRACRR